MAIRETKLFAKSPGQPSGLRPSILTAVRFRVGAWSFLNDPEWTELWHDDRARPSSARYASVPVRSCARALSSLSHLGHPWLDCFRAAHGIRHGTFLLVPAGKFRRGLPCARSWRDSFSSPLHFHTLTCPLLSARSRWLDGGSSPCHLFRRDHFSARHA